MYYRLKAESKARSMDNTGNPVPELSTLTLRIKAGDPEQQCCYVSLTLGEIEIHQRDDLHFSVGLQRATLKMTHSGFDVIDQRFLKRFDIGPEKTDPNATEVRTVTTDTFEAEGKLRYDALGIPSGQAAAKVSRQQTTERKRVEHAKGTTPTVEGKAGPTWLVSSSSEEKPLDGEYISFERPLLTMICQPGKNFLEVRGTVRIRQRDLIFKPLSKQTKRDRNQDAVIKILIAKGISQVTNEQGQFRGEIIVSDQSATFMAPPA